MPATEARPATAAFGPAHAAASSRPWLQAWSAVLLFLTLLYNLIGHTPYAREAEFDPATGAAAMSPVNRYIWLTLFALALPGLWARRSELLGACARLWPLLVLFAWFGLTTRWALDPGASLRRFVLYAVALAISLSVALGLADRRRLMLATGAACGLLVAIDLGSWMLAPELSMTELGLAAIHPQKNGLGAAMLFCSLVLAALTLTARRWLTRLGWGGLLVFAIAMLIASRSKTSLALAAALVLAAPLLYASLRARTIGVLGLALAAAAAAASALLLWLAVAYAQGEHPLSPLRGVTFTQRTDVWTFVLDEAAKRPIGGAGFGSFWDIDPRVQPSLQGDHWFAAADAYTNQAHNGYLDLLATTGWPGLALALAVLLRLVMRGLAHLRAAATGGGRDQLGFALAFGLTPLVVFVHNFMESSYFTANAMFGGLILLVGVALELLRPRASPGEPPDAQGPHAPWPQALQPRGTARALRRGQAPGRRAPAGWIGTEDPGR